MENPAGELNDGVLRLDFDRRLKLEFHGSRITSDADLLAYRELDDVLDLSAMAGDVLADSRTGRDGQYALVGLLRQSVFGRLAGYEDVNDAERLRHDPANHALVHARSSILAGNAQTSELCQVTEVIYRAPALRTKSVCATDCLEQADHPVDIGLKFSRSRITRQWP